MKNKNLYEKGNIKREKDKNIMERLILIENEPPQDL